MAASLKTMKLYSHVDRIHADLAAAGYGPDAALTVDVLTPFDQLHYYGTDAVDHALDALGVGVGAQILDLGSGFGGPARYAAQTRGVRVQAIELQADLDAAARDLTSRAGLSDAIDHVCSDVMTCPMEDQAWDGAFSFLALYHIPRRARLFPRLATALKPGAALYVEDLFLRAPLEPAERGAMRGMLAAGTLANEDDYREEVSGGGLIIDAFDDMTDQWARFTADRLTAFRARRAENTAVHGAEVIAALDEFYDTIAGLLSNGRVGGVRMLARRPVNPDAR